MSTSEVLPRGQTVERIPAVEAMASLAAGQLAGLVFLATLVILAALLQARALLFPMQVIASALPGEPGPGRLTAWGVLVGLLVNQLGPAMFWSIVYAVLVASAKGRLTLNQMLFRGFLVGGVAQIVDVDLLLPTLQESAGRSNLWASSVPSLSSWAGHLMYGLSLGLFYFLLRGPMAGAAARADERQSGRPASSNRLGIGSSSR